MASPKDPFNDDDDILEFTPEPGTPIEEIAPMVVDAMEILDIDAEIHFPTFTLEVPRGATEKDIIDAYYKVSVEYLPDLRPPPRPPFSGPKI